MNRSHMLPTVTVESTAHATAAATRASADAACAMAFPSRSTPRTIASAAIASGIAMAKMHALAASFAASTLDEMGRGENKTTSTSADIARSIAASLEKAAADAEPYVESIKQGPPAAEQASDSGDEDEQMQLALAMSLSEAQPAVEPSSKPSEPSKPSTPSKPSKPTAREDEPGGEEPGEEEMKLGMAMSESLWQPRPFASEPPLPPSPTATPPAAPSEVAKEQAFDGVDGVLVDPSDAGVGLTVAGEPVDPFPARSILDEALLDDLAEMGFENRELNKTLLLQYGGDLKRTVRALIER